MRGRQLGRLQAVTKLNEATDRHRVDLKLSVHVNNWLNVWVCSQSTFIGFGIFDHNLDKIRYFYAVFHYTFLHTSDLDG